MRKYPAQLTQFNQPLTYFSVYFPHVQNVGIFPVCEILLLENLQQIFLLCCFAVNHPMGCVRKLFLNVPLTFQTVDMEHFPPAIFLPVI